jgi:hypothetical protein
MICASALILLQNGAILPHAHLSHSPHRVGTCTVASCPFSRHCEPQIYKSRFHSPTIFSAPLLRMGRLILITLSHNRTSSTFSPHPDLSTSSRYPPVVSMPELRLTSGSEVLFIKRSSLGPSCGIRSLAVRRTSFKFASLLHRSVEDITASLA